MKGQKSVRRSNTVWLSVKGLLGCSRDFYVIEGEGFGDCLSLWVQCLREREEYELWSHTALVWSYL